MVVCEVVGVCVGVWIACLRRAGRESAAHLTVSSPDPHLPNTDRRRGEPLTACVSTRRGAGLGGWMKRWCKERPAAIACL